MRLFWFVVYAAVFACVGAALAARFHPEQGFTGLILFGDRFENSTVEATGAKIHHTSHGYDGQFYAKLALNPLLLRPFAEKELDNPPYRAGRILPSWFAAVFGFGDPRTTLHVYAAVNIVSWFLLAAFLLRWFPPVSLRSFVGWAGILLSTGMVTSLMRSLVDSPGLLLLAVSVWLLETGRPLAGSAALGLAGLTKETNLLALAGFAGPGLEPKTSQRTQLLAALLVLLPFAAWTLYVRFNIVPSGEGESSPDFALPLVEFWRKCLMLPGCLADGRAVFLGNVLPLFATTVQVCFIAATFRWWRNPWWRIGAAYALIFPFLGSELFESHLAAYTRAMLPLTLCFNMLCYRHVRPPLVVMIAGNAWLLCPILAFIVE